MTLHLTLNLWYVVWYLAAGAVLWPVMAVVTEWSIVSSRGVGTRLRAWFKHPWECVRSFMVWSAIWPVGCAIVYQEAVKSYRARRRRRQWPKGYIQNNHIANRSDR